MFSLESSHADPISSVILWVTVLFFLGFLGRFCARKLHQPSVLGELMMGILVGNLCYFMGIQLAIILREGPAIYHITRDLLNGFSLPDAVRMSISDTFYASQVVSALSGENGSNLTKLAYVIDIFARYGVIFLLFMVGLESSVEELKHTGKESLQVAILGVLAPILLGLLTLYILIPAASFNTSLFVAATLSATSIGITARVLKEMRKLKTREAQTILGAAMIDDILGLILLAVVSSIVLHGAVNIMEVIRIVISSVLFFTVAIAIGPWIIRKSAQNLCFLEPWEAKLVISFMFVMVLAWIATEIQLAAIIGAFTAGIIMHDDHFKYEQASPTHLSIRDLFAPFESILTPLFFMLIGMQVKLETFADWHVLLLAGGLIIAACAGKLISGLGGRRKDDRLLIGIAMLPRGEVGLVFASVGVTLGVISPALFTAIILMVIVTTVIAPPWLKLRFLRHGKAQPLGEIE